MFAAALTLTACEVPPAVRQAFDKTPAEKPAVATFQRLSYKDLPGWDADNHAAALVAFRDSCQVILARAPAASMGGDAIYGTSGQWRNACRLAATAKAPRAFFEQQFTPVQTFADGQPVGLFTGYYEPELRGSRQKSAKFHTPLYARPSDLVLVNLGEFRDTLKGERIAGRVQDGRLIPYATRAEIVGGGLQRSAKPLVYVDNAWEAFSLQIQGSGRVRFPDGRMIRVNYDGQNGHQYVAIGRRLVDRGAIKREDLSMQAIRAWLDANPKRQDEILNLNPSYVFFKEEPIGNPAQGAPGAMKVPLHSERSLAADLRYHALGAPVWVDATRPADKPGETPTAFQHLLVVHDTGGAIRGPVRGDVYWGAGPRAEELAGRMANRGRMIVLLPNDVARSVLMSPPTQP